MQEAFFNKHGVKAKAIVRAKAHQDAGRIVQKSFGRFEYQEPGTAEFRGCAVGCLAQPIEESFILDGFDSSYNLAQFLEANNIKPKVSSEELTLSHYVPLEEEFNFSKEFSGVVDAIFEGLPNEEAMLWPLKVVEGINIGADLSFRRIIKIVKNLDGLKEVIDKRFGDLVDWGSTAQIAGEIHDISERSERSVPDIQEIARSVQDEFIEAINTGKITKTVVV